MNIIHYLFIGIAGIRIRGKSGRSVNNSYNAQPQAEQTCTKVRQHLKILERLENGLLTTSCAVSSRDAGEEQRSLECQCTNYLQKLLDYINSNCLKNFQLRLVMEERTAEYNSDFTLSGAERW